MRRFLLSLSACLLLGGSAASLHAQATTEAAAGAAGASIGTAPASNIAKSLSGLAGALDGKLKNGQTAGGGPSKTQQTVRSTTTVGTKLSAAKPDAKLGDPMEIQAGMTREEVMRRFGPPNLQITDGPNTISLLYSSKSGKVRVEVQDGKVLSVDKPKPPQVAEK
jgi:hypothetical protein